MSDPVIRKRKLSEYKPDPHNANRGTERGQYMLDHSEESVGLGRSIVATNDDTIAAGNKTLQAAVDAGLEDVIEVETDGRALVVVKRTDWDGIEDEQARKYAYLDNRAGEVGLSWDAGQVLQDMQAGVDLSEMWKPEELDALLAEVQAVIPGGDPGAQLDRAEELRAKWGTKPDQLWLIPSNSVPGQAHRLLCGDSTYIGDVLNLMDGQRAVLFATDPPYLVDYTGENHPHAWNKPDTNKDWSANYHDWDNADQGEKLYDDFVAAAIEAAITEDAAWYCWHASRNQAMLERIWEQHGAFVHQQIIWVKDRPILTRSHYMWQHEPCLMGWQKGHKPYRVPDADNVSTVWTFPTIAPGSSTDHPTSKPVELFAIPILQHTRRGEICYEPFAGSGSQHVAGEQLGRLVYGLELQPEFVAAILERLSGMGLRPQLAQGA